MEELKQYITSFNLEKRWIEFALPTWFKFNAGIAMMYCDRIERKFQADGSVLTKCYFKENNNNICQSMLGQSNGLLEG